MKVVNAFAQLFAIFSFLTLGSLLVIVGLHVLSADDAILTIREVYESPWKSFQTVFLGLFFIGIGLMFSKMLLKQGKQSEAVIFQTEMGPMVISVVAIEDVVKKVLKRYEYIKKTKIKTLVDGKKVQIQLRFTLWSGSDIAEILPDVQTNVKNRVKKLLGPDNLVEVNCDVHKIEEESLTPEGINS